MNTSSDMGRGGSRACRHSRPPSVIPGPLSRHSRVGGNLDAPSAHHPANATSALRGQGVPMNTSSDMGRGGFPPTRE